MILYQVKDLSNFRFWKDLQGHFLSEIWNIEILHNSKSNWGEMTEFSCVLICLWLNKGKKFYLVLDGVWIKNFAISR